MITGEPGIGKSRLVEALLSRLEHEQHVRMRYFCAPNRQDSPLYPVIAQLERAAGITREDTAEQKLDKLETMLGQATADLGETVPLIAELLSIPMGDVIRRSSLRHRSGAKKRCRRYWPNSKGWPANQFSVWSKTFIGSMRRRSNI